MKFKNLSKKEKEEFLYLYLNKVVKSKDKIEELCKKFEISKWTAFKWGSKLNKDESLGPKKTKEKTTQEKVDQLREIYQNKEIRYIDRIRQISEKFGIGERAILNFVRKHNLTIRDDEYTHSEEFEQAKAKKINFEKNKFIITWAQSNTDIHENFFNNIEAYANYLNADIHVIAGRYKNPTSIFSDKDEKWHSRVLSYLDAARHNVHKHLSIMSDIKIQPTADYPTTGLQSFSGDNSCIFGAPKVHLNIAPVLEGVNPKIILTTGACTVQNYTDSKAGKKGEFYHTLGFAIVEIKNEEVFFVRQVTAGEDGNFIDLIHEVKDQRVEKINYISGCVLGDLHCGQQDPQLLKKTIELLEDLNPEHVVLHDVFDGYSISHHTINDPFVQYRKEIFGTNSLRGELDSMLDILAQFNKFKKVIIVRSNHDDFLDRWLKDGDWKKQPTAKNSMEYMELSYRLLKQYSKEEKVKGIIPELIKERYPNFITLDRTSSFIISGWEVGQHGDIGANGSRGSLIQYRNLNTKIIVGHYHSPGRIDGAVAVGTSTRLRLDYNSGPSGWLQSHVIIHKNGTAQHINFIEGEFTTFNTKPES